MRDLANAALRLSWAIPLFGMKQMLDLMTFQTATMADALNRVTNFAITPLATRQNTANNQIKQKDDMKRAAYIYQRRACFGRIQDIFHHA
jgi:hypothetical protein